MKLVSKVYKKGFSLIEILLVLGIIVVLAVGAFIVYENVSTRSMAEKEKNMIMEIKSNAVALSAQDPDFYKPSRNDWEYYKATILPPEYHNKKDSEFGKSPNGLKFSLASYASNKWQPDHLALRYYKVDKALCFKLITAIEPLAVRVSSGSDLVKDEINGKPLSHKKIGDACSRWDTSVGQLDFEFAT